jgi:hypothetical protein
VISGTLDPTGEQKIEDPNHDDFELWSPSESRDETCLFGRQVKPRSFVFSETISVHESSHER